MNRIRVYNSNELKILSSNPNVEMIKNKSQIQYSGNFKLWAVQEKIRNSEKTARQIFESAGFDMNILDERTPQKRLCSWKKKYKKFGSSYFINYDKYTYKALDRVYTDDKLYVLKIKNGDIYIFKTGEDTNESINC